MTMLKENRDERARVLAVHEPVVLDIYTTDDAIRCEIQSRRGIVIGDYRGRERAQTWCRKNGLPFSG